MKLKGMLLAVAAAVTSVAGAKTIVCAEAGPYHLQGVACDGEAIYWSFTTRIVKTDLSGSNVLAGVDVPMHSGDLCVHRGEVYVATDEGMFVRATDIRQEVRVYDAKTLAFKRKYALNKFMDAKRMHSSCIEYSDGRFWMPAGFDIDSQEESNYVLEFSPSFGLVAVHELATGHTQYGIQTIARYGSQFVMGTYSGPSVKSGAFVADLGCKGASHSALPASEGVMTIDGALYTVVSAKGEDGKWVATATSVDGIAGYEIAGNPGEVVDTPSVLLGYGFLAKSWYYGGEDQTVSDVLAGDRNLLANACDIGGAKVTLAEGAHAVSGGIAVPSGTLTLPSADLADGAAGPIVLSQGTLAFAGGGAMDRDVIVSPFAGYERRSAVLRVEAGATVTNTGAFKAPNNVGNLVKSGAGTFVIATKLPEGATSVTNRIGSNGAYGNLWRTTMNIQENGDGPTTGNPSFGIIDGRVVIDTPDGVVTEIGTVAVVGGVSTTVPDGETAGHLDILGGTVTFADEVAVGRYNGTVITAPKGLVSTLDVWGGNVSCVNMNVGYAEIENVDYTMRPEVNVHGGCLRVLNDVRLDHWQSCGKFTVDGGLFVAQKFRSANYYPGAYVEIDVSNGGEFRTTEHLALANHSTAEHPSRARVNVTDGGIFSLKTMTKTSEYSAADIALHFDGGVLKPLQSGSSDQIFPDAPITVGPKGMTIDVSGSTYWGLKINSPVTAVGETGGIAVVNGTDSAYRWVCFNGGVEVPGELTVENACVLFGKDVRAAVRVKDAVSTIRATADVTMDSLAFEGAGVNLECAMSGAAGDAGVRAYLLTAKEFTQPKGLITVTMMKTDTTSYSKPYGAFPFLRVPASAEVDLGRFVASHDASDYYRFTESVANGWRTISIVHGQADATKVDPRTGDWQTGFGKVWTLGPWLLPCNGDVTTANFMSGDKVESQSGGISVADRLTLTGGGEIVKGTFVKLGAGTLTLAGNETYSFGAWYVGQKPTTDPKTWDLFDASGNSIYAYSSGLLVGAGTLVLGTGEDSPTIKFPSANGLWVGSTTTSAAGGEQDAKMVVNSGVLKLNGELRIGSSHGKTTTAAHSPLVAEYVQNGGSASVNKLYVGLDEYGNGGAQTDTFTLNDGYFEALDSAEIGAGSTVSGNALDLRIVINGGRFEVGKKNVRNGSNGRLLLNRTSPKQQVSTFEMNGGETICWNGLQCWSMNEAGHNTQVKLNGGTLVVTDGILYGGDYSDLTMDGVTIKSYVPEHTESLTGTFKWFTTRTIGEGGVRLDMSDADVDAWDLSYSLDGTGDIVVSGGNTNRSVRFCSEQATKGDIIAEKGGVVQAWHTSGYAYVLQGRRVYVRDGGGAASYYGSPFKELHFGEKDTDVTVAYGYGYSSMSPLVASDALTVKGTVYLALRVSGNGNELRLPSGKSALLRGPKGCFAGVDVAKQFTIHPALVAAGADATPYLDDSNAAYDQICADSEIFVVARPNAIAIPAYPGRMVIDAPRKIQGTVVQTQMSADNNPNKIGTIEVNAPFEGDGTLKLTSGRIEGRPEFFNGITLDLNNASVRFTESGRTTANIVNSSGGETGLGLEVAEGKTVYVNGGFDNKSALVKMDPGTLVLQGSGDYTLLAAADKSKDSAWTADNVPKNGDVPYAAALAVNAGTLVLDTPGRVELSCAKGTTYGFIASHFIPDGTGGAYPAVLEIRQGAFESLNDDAFVVGRHVSAPWDDHSQFTKRPYAALNVTGGEVKFSGLILGYNNYKYNNCALYEVNLFDGRIEVGGGRMAIPHDSTNLKIGDDQNEGVVNVYGGELVKTSGPIALGGWYGDNAGKAYPAIGKLNVYGGAVRTAADGQIDVPHNKGGVGYVSLCGGLVETKNFVRNNSDAGTEGHIRFDGGTFRPLQNDGQLSGFTDVTVGKGGGVIDVPAGNRYIVAQKLKRAADIGDAEDGGFRSAGAGTLALNVANDFNGPVGAAGTSTLRQGVEGAFSDKAKMEGGTLDLNGIDTAFSEVRGHGTIIGNATVSGVLELDGALTFDGNLTLGAGTIIRMNVNDDGSAADYLRVTGSLVCNGPVVFDFMREYDDTALFGLIESEIGEFGDVSGFNAQTVNVSRGRRYVFDVVAAGGKIVLKSMKRGYAVFVK